VGVTNKEEGGRENSYVEWQGGESKWEEGGGKGKEKEKGGKDT